MHYWPWSKARAKEGIKALTTDPKVEIRVKAKEEKVAREEREKVVFHQDLSVGNVITAMKLVIMPEIALILEGNRSGQ